MLRAESFSSSNAFLISSTSQPCGLNPLEKPAICLTLSYASRCRSSRSFSVSLPMFPKSMNVARFSALRLSIMMLPVCTSLCITPLLKRASSIHFQMTCLKKSAL